MREGIKFLNEKTLIILCIVCITLFFFNLQVRDFWAPDEGDFAEIATELNNNFLVPHLNNTPYSEKPPLFYYIVYASKKALFWARDEASMRFPTALLAFFCTIFTFITVRKIFDKEMATLSTLILITAPLYYWQARYLQVDMVFSVFVVSGLFSFLWFYNTNKVFFFYLLFFFSGLAFITKGPLSIILTFPIVFLFLLLERNFRILKIKAVCIGFFVFLLVILPWYIAVYFKEGLPYLYENIVHQNLTRFFDAWSHKRPVYYYLTTLPLDFFPWSFFLPAGIYIAFTQFRNDTRVRFFLLWFLWMFLFFSISSGKISKYMLPVLPSISLMTAYAFKNKESRYNSIMFLLLSVVFLILGMLLFFFKTDMYREFFVERILLGSLCLILSATTFFFLKKKKQIYVFFAFLVFITTCYTIANSSVYKKLNLYKSPKPMCQKIKTYVRDSTSWIYYGSMRGIYIYYVGKYAVHIDEHKIDELNDVKMNLDQFYILTRKRDLKELAGVLTSVKIVFEEKIGDTVMVFAYYGKRDIR